MKFLGQRMLIATLIVVLSGCGVSKEELNAVVAESNALTAKVKELIATVTALENARNIELGEANQKTTEVQAKLDQANQKIVALKSQIAELEKKLKDVEWEKLTLELKMDKPKKKKESKEKTSAAKTEIKEESKITNEKG